MHFFLNKTGIPNTYKVRAADKMSCQKFSKKDKMENREMTYVDLLIT